MQPYILSVFIFISLVGCDAHLSVRRDLPLSAAISENCLDKVIRTELPNGKLEASSSDGAKYWQVHSDSCSFEIDQEDRIANDGKVNKALIFTKSIITDGLFRFSGNRKIQETEQCIEKVKPAIQKQCFAAIK